MNSSKTTTDPRTCNWCGNPLVPKIHENPSHLKRRRFCNRTCSGNYTNNLRNNRRDATITIRLPQASFKLLKTRAKTTASTPEQLVRDYTLERLNRQ